MGSDGLEGVSRFDSHPLPPTPEGKPVTNRNSRGAGGTYQ
jgi:hypothetical protein